MENRRRVDVRELVKILTEAADLLRVAGFIKKATALAEKVEAYRVLSDEQPEDGYLLHLPGTAPFALPLAAFCVYYDGQDGEKKPEFICRMLATAERKRKSACHYKIDPVEIFTHGSFHYGPIAFEETTERDKVVQKHNDLLEGAVLRALSMGVLEEDVDILRQGRLNG